MKNLYSAFYFQYFISLQHSINVLEISKLLNSECAVQLLKDVAKKALSLNR